MAKLNEDLVLEIRDAVQARREDAVSLLQELVRTRSVTGVMRRTRRSISDCAAAW